MTILTQYFLSFNFLPGGDLARLQGLHKGFWNIVIQCNRFQIHLIPKVKPKLFNFPWIH